MTKGYNSDSTQYDCMQLDVLLAEYVDGTIDPVVREVFEELMAQEPEVADRVQRLARVRRRLCGLGCRCAAPPGFESRLKQHIAEESISDEDSGSMGIRYTTLLTLVVLTLLAGSATYSVLVADEPSVTQQTELVNGAAGMQEVSATYVDGMGGLQRISPSTYPWSSATSGMVMASYSSEPSIAAGDSLRTNEFEVVPLSVP